jgi:outer membrane protein assembly factor BamB
VDAIRLCKYDPKQKRIIFFSEGLPFPDGRYGTVKPEAYFNFHDGYVYVSGFNGSLYRIDPETGHATYLFTPTPDRPSRLASLVGAGDGVAYGVTGRKGQCELMRVNYRLGTFERLGAVRDSEGNALWQCHDIIRTSDGRLYLCENDHPQRSSYLWEITLE